MAYTVFDKGTGANDHQSIFYEEYVKVLIAGVHGIDSVESGCAVTAQGSPDMTVAVASGGVRSNGAQFVVTGGNVTVGTADGTHPRIDLIVVNSSGSKTIRAGTAAATPKPPARTANDVVLAAVYVPASDTAITDSPKQIMDLRVFHWMWYGSDPPTDDGDALGTTSLKWSDLFLSTGAVINFNSGAVTLTHGTNVLTIAGGSLVTAACSTTIPGLQLQAGTLQTTPQVGGIELDADCIYGCTDAGNRGVIPIVHVIRAPSAQTLTSTTSAQNIFDSPANGRVTIETGAYLFELMVLFTGMSATTGNGQILFGGTGTFADWLWASNAIDGTAGTTLLDLDNAFNVTNASAALVAATQTATTLRVWARGSFECSAGGTLIPQIALTTAAAATVAAGSFFRLERIGAQAMASVGQWD